MGGEEQVKGVEEELMMMMRGMSENVEELMIGKGGGGCWRRVQWVERGGMMFGVG